MVLWGVEHIIGGAVLVTVLAIPVLSPVAGLWLTALIVLLNCFMLLTSLLALLSPRISLALMTLMAQVIHLPFWRLVDFHAHFHLDMPPTEQQMVRTEAAHAAGREEGGEEDGGAGGRDGVAAWVRQMVFVLTVVLCQSHLGLWTFLTSFFIWLLGVHALLAPLTAVLAVITPRHEDLSSAALSPATDSPSIATYVTNTVSDSDDLTCSPLPVYLAELGLGVACLAHCACCISSWELLGMLVFSVCSDQRVQKSLKLQACKLQVDLVEGFEGELLHGCLILIDMLVCAAFFVRAMRQEDYLVLVLSYSNAFIALMELRVRVWLEMQAGLRRMSDLRRATRLELAAHNDVCAVCLGAMNAARITRCRHMFHGKCLRQALRVSPQCPLCKKRVVTHSVYLIDPAAAEFDG